MGKFPDSQPISLSTFPFMFKPFVLQVIRTFFLFLSIRFYSSLSFFFSFFCSLSLNPLNSLHFFFCSISLIPLIYLVLFLSLSYDHSFSLFTSANFSYLLSLSLLLSLVLFVSPPPSEVLIVSFCFLLLLSFFLSFYFSRSLYVSPLILLVLFLGKPLLSLILFLSIHFFDQGWALCSFPFRTLRSFAF